MTAFECEYSLYFKEEEHTKIAIKLGDNKFLDVTGIVRFIEGDRLTLDLVGTEPVEEMTAEPGTDVHISNWIGWSLCRCNAVLIQKIYGRRVFLQLIGPVIEKQARDHFRLDVSFPLCYTILEQQLLPAVHDEWAAARRLLNELAAPVLIACADGFKVVRWNGKDEITSHLVNLSGGGMRFKTPVYVTPESLVAINLFLPIIPPRVIHIVAETLRCREIVLSRVKENNYITAMRFHFINDKDRETIIAFIFAEQRRILSARIDKNF